MKHKSKWISIVAAATLIGAPSVVSPASQVHATTVDTSQSQENNNVENSITITNKQVLEGATRAYEAGEISKSDYQIMYSELTQRSGTQGVTKVVEIDSETAELYLNSTLTKTIVRTGEAATVLAALKAIPAAAAWLSKHGGLAAALGYIFDGFTENSLNIDNGIIITLKKDVKPMPGGYTEPTWVSTNIRSQ